MPTARFERQSKPYSALLPFGLCVRQTQEAQMRSALISQGSYIRRSHQPTYFSARGAGLSGKARRATTVSAMAPYTLYTWTTPNGWKASIMMEELGLQYESKGIDISTNVQKEPWFEAINPNGRIPALVDHENGDLAVFETGAIMWYLCEKVDKEGKFWPKDFNKRAEVMSWLMYQMGGVGPMQGQANHFVRYAPERIFYGMNRYVNETKRLYEVMDKHLAKHEWLAADQYTIADIANFSWVFMSAWSGVDCNEFPNLKKWVDKIYARPAVQKGLAVPKKGDLVVRMSDPADYKKAYQDAVEIISKAKAAAGK